jgi:threonine aldolase
MGNQIAIKVHTRPGQEIICEDRAHILDWEMGMPAFFSGCLLRPLHGDDGILTWTDIKKKIHAISYSRSQTGLIEVENTHNMAGGTITPVPIMEEICDAAHERGIPVHLDGARIFNAAIALGQSVAQITRKFDSVMFCLSKGLAAPVGSVLVGSRKFIDEARSVRKALGGGMRQAGILAAAGLIAIEEMPKRLHEDHANAKLLAQGLEQVSRIKVYHEKVKTNIVVFDTTDTAMTPTEMLRRLREQGLIASTAGDSHIRLLTHKDVSRADCARAVKIIGKVCKN